MVASGYLLFTASDGVKVLVYVKAGLSFLEENPIFHLCHQSLPSLLHVNATNAFINISPPSFGIQAMDTAVSHQAPCTIC